MLLGDRQQVAARTPMPVHDVMKAASKTQVTSESVSFADGAAGTTQRLKLTYDGVMALRGDRLGEDGDTSITWGTGTVLITEVSWKLKNIARQDNETARLALLANGEYMVDYENGYILGKNAISTSSTPDTISYKVRLATATVDAITFVSTDSGDSYSKDSSTALESQSLSKASAGNFYKATGRVDATAASGNYFFQLIDSASIPSDGAETFIMTPVKIVHTLGTDTYFDIDAAPAGLPASSGIVWCLSTAEFTKSADGSFASVTVAYK